MSNKLNYTPAPWNMFYSMNGVLGVYHQIKAGTNHRVAAITKDDPDQYVANAKLIAAAPDMYELIRRVSHAGNETTVEQLAQQAAMLLAKLEAHND